MTASNQYLNYIKETKDNLDLELFKILFIQKFCSFKSSKKSMKRSFMKMFIS